MNWLEGNVTEKKKIEENLSIQMSSDGVVLTKVRCHNEEKGSSFWLQMCHGKGSSKKFLSGSCFVSVEWMLS